MSETDSRAEVDSIAKTIESIVKSDTIAQDDKERALATMAESLTRLISAAQLGHASLRATQNAHASGAARLSPEAVSIIILFLDKLEDRLLASHVCRLWRSVALDMPKPWPEVFLHSLGEIDMGCTKHLEVEQDHCYYDVLDKIFLKIDSNLHRLSGLLDLSWEAPVLVDVQLTSHCDMPSDRDLRQKINKIWKSDQPVTRARLAAALGPDVSSHFIDLLHPLSAATDRIVSLTLTTNCNDWLILFACLPRMTALRTLVVRAADNWAFQDQPVVVPSVLWSIFQLREGSRVVPRVAFPVLETLDVDGIFCTDSSGKRLRISAGRVVGLLASMPLLRSLALFSVAWPIIVPDEGDDAAEPGAAPAAEDTGKSSNPHGKASSRVKLDLKNLKNIDLSSPGGDDNENNRSISLLKNILGVRPGCDPDSDEDVSEESP